MIQYRYSEQETIFQRLEESYLEIVHGDRFRPIIIAGGVESAYPMRLCAADFTARTIELWPFNDTKLEDSTQQSKQSSSEL